MLKSRSPARTVIPEHLMLMRLAQAEHMREFFIQMWLQNPQLARQGGAKVSNLLSPLAPKEFQSGLQQAEEQVGMDGGAKTAQAKQQGTGNETSTVIVPVVNRNNKSGGFSLVTAIFLLVVLGGLGAVMMTFFTAQQQSSALDVMGARAYQAARAGIEWGAYQALQNTSCVASQTLPVLGGTLAPFTVTVTCSANNYSEVTPSGSSITVYDITATATFGAVGQLDRVERQLQATIGQ